MVGMGYSVLREQFKDTHWIGSIHWIGPDLHEGSFMALSLLITSVFVLVLGQRHVNALLPETNRDTFGTSIKTLDIESIFFVPCCRYRGFVAYRSREITSAGAVDDAGSIILPDHMRGTSLRPRWQRRPDQSRP
jgi:hypothetical protein